MFRRNRNFQKNKLLSLLCPYGSKNRALSLLRSCSTAVGKLLCYHASNPGLVPHCDHIIRSSNFLVQQNLTVQGTQSVSNGFLSSCIISRKTNERIPRKVRYGRKCGQTVAQNGWTNGRTDRREFIGPNARQDSKKNESR